MMRFGRPVIFIGGLGATAVGAVVLGYSVQFPTPQNDPSGWPTYLFMFAVPLFFLFAGVAYMLRAIRNQ